MEKAAWISTFTINGGTSIDAFTTVAKRLSDEVVSKQKGFIAWEQYRQDDIWTDLVLWETIEDALSSVEVAERTSQAEEYFSFIDLEGCKTVISKMESRFV